MARTIGGVLLLLVAACGNISRKGDDAGIRDDAPIDATMIDATMIDATPVDAPPATPAREIVGGAGRLTGATYMLDVEVGHSFSQNKASGATYTIEGNAAVKP